MEVNPRSDGTVRLDLFTRADAPVLCEGDHDPEHRLRFDFPADFIPSLQHAESVIERWEQERLSSTRLPFAVRDSATGELLGGCELQPLGDGVANLSYWTYPKHRQRGVATRAIALACAVAFQELRLRQLEVVTAPDNLGSRRAALHNGFQEVGEREGQVLHLLEAQKLGCRGATFWRNAP